MLAAVTDSIMSACFYYSGVGGTWFCYFLALVFSCGKIAPGGGSGIRSPPFIGLSEIRKLPQPT